MKIGIIGASGFVGTAMRKLFPDAVCYDKFTPFAIQWVSPITNKVEQRNISMKDIDLCDACFLCVPTPNEKNAELDMSIVEEVVKECKCPLIIIRSTLQPGTADKLAKKYNKNIVVMPEYVGESVAHPLLDEATRPFVIIGGEPKDRRKTIEILQQVYNANISIRQVTRIEAEVIKLSENRAIAFKVGQIQELYDACEKNGTDFYTIRDAVYGDDPRFTLWWTFAYPEKRGFNSPCIPKDIFGWSAWAGKPELTEALLKYNDKLIKGGK